MSPSGASPNMRGQHITGYALCWPVRKAVLLTHTSRMHDHEGINMRCAFCAGG